MKIIRSNQGFTVIEILIALLLITIVMAVAISDPFSGSKELDKEVEHVQRAIRFMGDEAVLKNSVIRFHFFLDKEPQEYAIEYGPSDQFVLPPEDEAPETLSIEEAEKAEKENKDLNLKFNKVKEFQESNYEVNENVRIVAIGQASSNELKTKGEVSLYAFATGEKDQAIIFVGNETSVVSLEIEPFTNNVNKNTYPLDSSSNLDMIEAQNKKAKEIFESWAKNQK